MATPKIDLSEWPVAVHKPKKYKLFFDGPPGCFKTRTALHLADNHDFSNPATAMIDLEFGSDHYRDQFAFRIPPIDPFDLKPDTVYQLVKAISRKPGNIKTVIIDSFSVFYDMLTDLWVERFLLREITSAGNKSEYYTLQPRDYVHINRDASKLVGALLYSDLNVICICQEKAQYEFQAGSIKVIGQTADGWKRLAYYFDTLIDISKETKVKGWKAVVAEKGRTNTFQVGEVIPWTNDAAICEYIIGKFGQPFYDGPLAEPFDPDAAYVASKSLDEALSGKKVTNTEPVKEADTATEEEAPFEPTPEPTATPAPEAPETDQSIIEKNDAPIKTETLMECLGEVRKLGFDKPELIAAVKHLHGVEKPSQMTEGQGRDLIRMILRGEFPTIGNSGQ